MVANPRCPSKSTPKEIHSEDHHIVLKVHEESHFSFWDSIGQPNDWTKIIIAKKEFDQSKNLYLSEVKFN